MPALPAPRWVLLYDGVCGLCHGLVQFLIRRDHRDQLRFAPLQSPFAAQILTRHGHSPQDLDTVYLVEHPNTPQEHLRDRAKAVLTALAIIGGPWRLFSLLRVLPPVILNLGYRMVARVRYRLFGRFSACQVPTPAQRAKFLD